MRAQFQCWNMVLDFQVIIYALIWSFREVSFDVYIEAIAELLPYFFVDNNAYCGYWVTVHLVDMISLEDVAEFHIGNFIVQ